MPQSQRNKGTAKDDKKERKKRRQREIRITEKERKQEKITRKFLFLCFCFYQKIIHESLLYWSEQSERQYNITVSNRP